MIHLIAIEELIANASECLCFFIWNFSLTFCCKFLSKSWILNCRYIIAMFTVRTYWWILNLNIMWIKFGSIFGPTSNKLFSDESDLVLADLSNTTLTFVVSNKRMMWQAKYLVVFITGLNFRHVSLGMIFYHEMMFGFQFRILV